MGPALITHDVVTNIADANTSLYGCQFGIGIAIGHQRWPTIGCASSPIEDFTGSATITHSTVSGYHKDGIDIIGPGSYAQVSDDTVTATGPTSLFQKIAPSGIEVARGDFVQIQGTTVSGNQYSGPAEAGGAGILLFGGSGLWT